MLIITTDENAHGNGTRLVIGAIVCKACNTSRGGIPVQGRVSGVEPDGFIAGDSQRAK